MLLSFLILMSFYGFSPARTTIGDVTLSIADIEPITELEQEIPVLVTIANSGTEALKGDVKLGVIDNWRIIGEGSQPFQVPPGQAQELRFRCVAGTGTYAAHYPVHATATLSDGQKVHTVLVVEVTQEAVSKFISVDESPRTLKLKSPGLLDLTSLKDARVSFPGPTVPPRAEEACATPRANPMARILSPTEVRSGESKWRPAAHDRSTHQAKPPQAVRSVSSAGSQSFLSVR